MPPGGHHRSRAGFDPASEGEDVAFGECASEVRLCRQDVKRGSAVGHAQLMCVKRNIMRSFKLLQKAFDSDCSGLSRPAAR